MSEVKDSFDNFGRYLVQQSRSNLSKKKHKNTSALYDSLGYAIKESKNSIQFDFYMEDYGDFVDKGVKGKIETAKAPNSPYRFGSGTGRKGGLREAISKWVRQKRFQFRGPKGRFMSYESMTFLISRSIYLTGLRTTEFYSKPFERAMKKFPDELVEKYALDMESLLKNRMKKPA